MGRLVHIAVAESSDQENRALVALCGAAIVDVFVRSLAGPSSKVLSVCDSCRRLAGAASAAGRGH